MLQVALFGAGRIGQIHGRNVAARDDARVCCVIDTDPAAAARLAAALGAEAGDAAIALRDPAISAVVIATSTDTHAALIQAAARAGKAIFCEKPLDLDAGRATETLTVVTETGALLALGFNRRYDPSFRRLRDEIAAGRIGRVEVVSITSRDPAPPPAGYIGRSGGLFRDMMIHDLDMARWLLGGEPVRVYARGSVIRNELPSAPVCSSVRWPPMASIAPLASDSPRPVPSTAPSPWRKKRSKIRPRASCEMPGPESITSTVARSGVSAMRIRILPASGVNLIALSTRLINA